MMFVFEDKTTGYSKILKGRSIEDATLTSVHDDYIVMAVADGHGALQCKYADRGANFATMSIIEALESRRTDDKDIKAYGEFLNADNENIIKDTVRIWTKRVLEDYFENYASAETREKYSERILGYVKDIYRDYSNMVLPAEEVKRRVNERCAIENAIYKITNKYGTTINAVVITDKFIFAIGIGDGDVVVVNKKRVEWLLPMADQYDTHPASLCNAFDDILYNYSYSLNMINTGRGILDSYFKPDIVMISTDGLRNSYNADFVFADQIVGIANSFRQGKGRNVIKASHDWIKNRTKMRGGDDISYCLCSRFDPDTGRNLKVQQNHGAKENIVDTSDANGENAS